MHQNQRVDATTGNDRGPCDSLAECGRCAEYANIVRQHGGNGIFLIWPQGSDELHVDRRAVYPFVMYVAADAVASKQFLCGVQAATRKTDVLGEVFSTADDPGLVPNRHAHGLRPVELRVLKGREANQAVGQTVELVAPSRNRRGSPR